METPSRVCADPTRVVAGRHIAHARLVMNSLTPWFTTRVDVVDGIVTFDVPTALLGILPLGRRRTDAPIAVVQQVRVGWQARPERAIACALLAACAASSLLSGWGDVFAIVLAIWLLPLSVIAVLRVRLTDGRELVLPVCVAARGRARRVADRLTWIRERVA